MGFTLRRAAPGDAATIAWHRARMFQDMGEVPAAMFEPLRAASEKWLKDALASGEYIGWLAHPASAPDLVAGGGGVQLRRVLPHLLKRESDLVELAEGRHAIVLNVFTEPEWRQKGIATLLMREIILWAGTEKLDRLVLHASAQGRQLYERLGFISTNEMRYARDLLPPNEAFLLRPSTLNPPQADQPSTSSD